MWNLWCRMPATLRQATEIGAAVILLGLFLGPSPPVNSGPELPPPVVVESIDAKSLETPASANLDFGLVHPGRVVRLVATYRHSRSTRETLRFTSPSPDVTVRVAGSSHVEHGENRPIVFDVNTKTLRGRIHQAVYLFGDEGSQPDQALAKFEIRGNVRNLIEIQPPPDREISFGNVPPATPVWRDVFVAEIVPGTIQAQRPTITPPWLILESREQQSPEGSRTLQIRIGIPPNAEVGPFQGALDLRLGSERLPSFSLSVSGRILGEL